MFGKAAPSYVPDFGPSVADFAGFQRLVNMQQTLMSPYASGSVPQHGNLMGGPRSGGSGPNTAYSRDVRQLQGGEHQWPAYGPAAAAAGPSGAMSLQSSWAGSSRSGGRPASVSSSLLGGAADGSAMSLVTNAFAFNPAPLISHITSLPHIYHINAVATADAPCASHLTHLQHIAACASCQQLLMSFGVQQGQGGKQVRSCHHFLFFGTVKGVLCPPWCSPPPLKFFRS